MLRLLSVLFLIAATTLTCPTFAGEKIFGYSYTAEPFPKGALEVYSWTTYRANKGAGKYRALDIRQEIEYGWTDKTAVAMYLNQSYHKIENAAPTDENGDPEYANRESFNFQGVQFAAVHNLKSPYQNPYGLSLYFEPGYSTVFKITGQRQQEYSFEFKVLFQKNFMDDTLIFAFNFSPEWEWRRFEGEDDFASELAVEATTGLSYRLRSNWMAGLEARYHSEYPDTEFPIEHYALFLGPNIHYAKKHFWATLTFLPQVYGWMDDHSRRHNLHLSEHEVHETRLVMAWTL
ncbi:MAG: DUF6662 family protein [Bdellovibrionales bacterium]